MSAYDHARLHTRKFGGEGVIETFKKQLTHDELVSLAVLCEEVDDAKAKFKPKRRGTAQSRATRRINRLLATDSSVKGHE